jgi:hypothetical protein
MRIAIWICCGLFVAQAALILLSACAMASHADRNRRKENMSKGIRKQLRSPVAPALVLLGAALALYAQQEDPVGDRLTIKPVGLGARRVAVRFETALEGPYAISTSTNMTNWSRWVLCLQPTPRITLEFTPKRQMEFFKVEPVTIYTGAIPARALSSYTPKQ